MSQSSSRPQTDSHPDQPLSSELLRWAREQAAAGVPAASLKAAMVDAGWQETAAHATLDYLASGQAAPPPHTSTAASPLGGGTPTQPRPDLREGLPQLQAAGHAVGVLVHQQHPPLTVFSELLTPVECAALISAARPRLARSLTVETQTGGEEVNDDRTSEGMFFERGESDLIAAIEARIAALLHWPVEFGEGLQVLRYGPGAQYKPHYDYFDPSEPGTPAVLRRGGQRLATLIMYLNTPLAGGSTVFPQIGLDVLPQRGNAVFFGYESPHPETRTLHGGAPVLQGEKWIATKWLRERKFE